ncbi:CHASE2 domain-containing protein [Calothrix sp. FACHB-1219]|uniref:CHASE2 domain-containing protein n=1 Tax=unclassified Calothrix TaxID=2619626 RepID=UPI0016827ABD|nr:MULTISPECIES: CHASE2 domain-containing protein [unclassified Calothrix]MBD2206472.1 CHASE2 domain-containing protein [Calothrix sp. FACHB-168]MBD2220349.1 CHASE2 domain-containing protein [Calothrix sp. FACHB-1219]
MSKLLVFSLLGGDFKQGFAVVTAQLWDTNQSLSVKFIGSLPPVPELPNIYHKWRLLYEAVHCRLGSKQRIKVNQQDITNISINDFNDVCQQLQRYINDWLKSESFQNIERQLRTLLSPNDEIRVIFETNVALLHRLPWHLWDFFEHYPQAELALSNQEYSSLHLTQKTPTGKVKILAILGNSVGIDIEKDRYWLEGLADTQVKFLVEPTRKELDEQLWNQDWDILFFAGHSASLADGELGQIDINQTDSLTIPQLKNALKKVILQGLKLAIFNSCDGIGLARNLADLNIPQMIVMREPIPDLVAQEFLKKFLSAFAGGKTLYAAVREARERLQGLENDFPCASWLPLICQNPTTVPVTWQELCGNSSNQKFIDIGLTNSDSDSKSLDIGYTNNSSDIQSLDKGSTNSRISTPKCNLQTVILTSVIIAASTIGLRYLGILQTAELQTLDHMLRLRPKQEQDSRLLVVEITEKDIQSYQQEIVRGTKSIPDHKLAQLLHKIQQYQPRVIGLDLYRDSQDPKKPNQRNLVDELKADTVVVACKGKDSKFDPQGVQPPNKVPVERQGFTDGIEDSDYIVRRQILMMEQEASSPCKTIHSLSFQLAARYLFDENIQVNVNKDDIKFGDQVLHRLKPGYSGGYQQGVDLGGFQILVNYRDTNFQKVSLEDIFNDKVNPELVKDKIILIGVTANTVSDIWATPYSVVQQPARIPGVLIQAQMVSQIISAVLDQRVLLWVFPYWGDILWILGWSLISGLFIWRINSRLGQGCTIVATVIVLYGVCTVIISISGAWVPFVPSTLAVILTASGIAARKYKPYSSEFI